MIKFQFRASKKNKLPNEFQFCKEFIEKELGGRCQIKNIIRKTRFITEDNSVLMRFKAFCKDSNDNKQEWDFCFTIDNELYKYPQPLLLNNVNYLVKEFQGPFLIDVCVTGYKSLGEIYLNGL